jgi:hypothetical protein
MENCTITVDSSGINSSGINSSGINNSEAASSRRGSELELIEPKLKVCSSTSVITQDAPTTANDLILIIENKSGLLKLVACTLPIIILTLCTVFNIYCMVSFSMHWNTLATYTIAVLISTIVSLDLVQKIRYTGGKPKYMSIVSVPILIAINIGIGPRDTDSAAVIDKLAVIYVYCCIAACSTLFLLLLVWIYLPDKDLTSNSSNSRRKKEDGVDHDAALAFAWVHIIQTIVTIIYSAITLYYDIQYLLNHNILIAVAIANAIYMFSITRIALHLVITRECNTMESAKSVMCEWVGILSGIAIFVIDLCMLTSGFSVDAEHSMFKGFIVLNNGIVSWIITSVGTFVLVCIVIGIMQLLWWAWYWFGTYIIGITGIKMCLFADGDSTNTSRDANSEGIEDADF